MNLKKIMILVLVIFLLIPAVIWLLKVSLNNEKKVKHVYRGENNLWAAELRIEYSYTFKPQKVIRHEDPTISKTTQYDYHHSPVKTTLKITYTGDIEDINNYNLIEYQYKSSVSSRTGAIVLTPSKREFSNHFESNGNAIPAKDEIVDLIISYGNHKSELKLSCQE